MTEPMDQSLEIIELREELQRAKLLLQNCNGDIVRADRELASLREQLNSQKDRCIDLFEKVSEREEVIRELMLVAEGYIYYYRNVHPNDEFGKIKDVNSLIEKAKSLITKNK